MPHKPHLPKDAPREFRLALVEGNASRHVAAFLEQRRHVPAPDHFRGTGCVMAAGGRRYLREAFVTISRIRVAGWRWPIEIWHLGPKEVPDQLRRKFDQLDVLFVDAHEVRKVRPARQLNGWELKSFALAWCRFQNVLLLDADCAPVRDPIPLFGSPEFQEHGVVFWPDIKPCMESDRVFGFIGVHKPMNYVEVESGQMIIDKDRCWKALELTRWMNDYSEFWFRHFHGDKSTFDLAFLRAGQPYLMAPSCSWMGYGIEHKWFDGEPLFEHRMSPKRNAAAFVSEEDRFNGSVFDRGLIPR